MKLETIKLDQLNPADYNPRQITKEEFEGLKESLKTFGQQENLIVNKDMTIISGHQRYEAMKALGWQEAVCNVVDLDKKAEKKLNIIMNSTAISGKYDDLKLSEILEELKLDDDYESLRLDKIEPLDLSMPTDDNWADAFDDNAPDKIKGLRQMTVILHEQDIPKVKEKLTGSKNIGEALLMALGIDYDSTPYN